MINGMNDFKYRVKFVDALELGFLITESISTMYLQSSEIPVNIQLSNDDF